MASSHPGHFVLSHPLRSLVFLLLVTAPSAWADGPGDNNPLKVRPVPPPGIALADADRAELTTRLQQLGREIDGLRDTLRERPELLALLPDVQVLHSAVQSALAHNEFFDAREISRAHELIGLGMDRARELREGKPSWPQASGLVVRGYVSRIDGSVQPYGLVVPASFATNSPHRFRLDVWCHGRNEKLSEVNFLYDRLHNRGEFTPRDAFVLHPYGRFCNANKFAGEIDLFEALDDIQKRYPIDDDRLVMRGFSMGGAACWQFAVHYPSIWAAAAPGAGFAETAEFLRVFQNEKVSEAGHERQLRHLYDCTDYALNLFNCPTVAYSGEKDRQKQAADIMARALAAEGIDLVHVIGKGAGHQYTPEAKAEINRRIDAIVAVGRQAVPRRIRFTTWNLRYNRCAWLEVDGLEEHWQPARVEAELAQVAAFQTKNISAFTLNLAPGQCPEAYWPVGEHQPQVVIDGKAVQAPGPGSDRSWVAHFRKVEGRWQSVASPEDGSLHKRHGLQGPIDDAFLDSFLMVRPTGKARHERIGAWTTGEMTHAIDRWRTQFRGDARVKDDRDVTEADIAAHNLVLWGDPESNALIAKVLDRLPLKWDRDAIRLGPDAFDAGHHVPVLVFPNPLNPARYVVLNSGFTYREYDDLNNARQIPKLPDFAILDIDSPPSPRSPGRVARAGFFNERWELPAR